MKFFTLFEFLTRLRKSKHMKFFSTYLVEQNWTKWKTCFSPIQNGKKGSQLKHKNQVRNRIFIELSLRILRIILVITWWAHKRQTFTWIWIKIMRIRKYLFTNNRVFKHKEFVYHMHVCSNGLEKMWPSYTFHFATRILTSKHTKEFNISFA